MIKAIIFDLDRTLLDRDATFARFVAGQYLRFPELQAAMSSDDYLRQIETLDKNGYKAKDRLWTKFASSHAIDLDTSRLLNDFNHHYGTEPVLFESSRNVLESLVPHFQLGMVTNGNSRIQNNKIDCSGIRSFFSTVIVSGDVGIHKPDPEIYKRCLNRMGLDASDCLFVGDHPDCDIEGPKSVGMQTIWIENNRFPAPNGRDATIRYISELPEQLPVLLN